MAHLDTLWKAPRQRLMDSTGLKTAVLFGLLAVAGIWIAASDLTPDLAHLRVAVLSGSEKGNYHAIVRDLAAEAEPRRGLVTNVATAGSVDNVARLAAARERCDAHFALVQGGVPVPSDAGLRLVGRLRKAETLFFLGRDADRIHAFADLRGLTVGIGPEGSGAADVGRRILQHPDFAGLGLRTRTLPLDEQIDALAAGRLDLGLFVIDEDAALVTEAVRARGLQIAGFEHADVLARRPGALRVGRIAAGQFDPVHLLPPEDKKVLRVDTLVLGNGCASRSETAAFVGLLATVFPDFVSHNRDTPNTTGLPLDPAARAFFDDQGPDVLTEYFPRLADLMPLKNWVHVGLGVSILFNIMGFWHRFRLWRVDANRVKAELWLPLLFGPGVTPEEVARLVPGPQHRSPEARAQLETLIARLDVLITRCRRQSLSVLVPMGQEMAYRYQERLMTDLLTDLRAFRARRDAGEGAVEASAAA